MKTLYQILFICSLVTTPSLHAMLPASIGSILLSIGTAAIKNKELVLFAFNSASQTIQQYFNRKNFNSIKDDINKLRTDLIERIETTKDSIESSITNLETNFNGNLENTRISISNKLTEIRGILSSMQTTLNNHDEALNNIFSDTTLLKNKLSSLEINFRNFRDEFSTFSHDTKERLSHLASDTALVREDQVEQKSATAVLLTEVKEIKIFTANIPRMEEQLNNIPQMQKQLNNISQMLEIFGNKILQDQGQALSCHQSAILTEVH